MMPHPGRGKHEDSGQNQTLMMQCQSINLVCVLIAPMDLMNAIR